VPAPWEKAPAKPLAIASKDPVNNPAPIVYADASDASFAATAASLAPAAGTPAKGEMVYAQADTAPVATTYGTPGRMVTATEVGNGTIDSEGGGAIPALPLTAMQSPTGVNYITGGVGDEELDQLKTQSDNYNLHLLISAQDGAFMSQATVRILDSKGGELLNITDAGPYVYAKLPVGTYTIEVTADGGASKSATAKVPAKGFVKPQVRF
jgi:hypothetical protein